MSVLSVLAAVAYARPEPPSNGYGAPSPSASGGGFGGPSAPGGSYGAPPQLPPQPHFTGSSQAYGPPQQAPVVHKHVYVHVPPHEPEYSAPQKPIHVAPPQKHYKIVFIKAPTPPTPTAPVIPLQPQDQEKTLIYVLVKKPEEQPEVIIPTPAPTQPAKPEVYFIKYKTQKQEAAGGYPESIAPAPSGDYGAPAPSGSSAQAPGSQYGAPL
ncbi:developmental and secondary metabolism regulator VEL1-like [Ctenocephalides felis]|uniref:developmental and secondary metabolism regulator VEL1-like n=1 Tax=Ctenocephalides felis TaxID=7515 RepID=UPI000E6E4DA6|nr:developmental and secondary metabolism regulator VEL1-like [Ctenocephalides felis]